MGQSCQVAFGSIRKYPVLRGMSVLASSADIIRLHWHARKVLHVRSASDSRRGQAAPAGPKNATCGHSGGSRRRDSPVKSRACGVISC